MRKLLSVFMSIVLVVGLMPLPAYAEPEPAGPSEQAPASTASEVEEDMSAQADLPEMHTWTNEEGTLEFGYALEYGEARLIYVSALAVEQGNPPEEASIDLVIPSAIEGVPVTKLGYWTYPFLRINPAAFRSVTIPATVYSIYENCFADSSHRYKVTSVTFEEGINLLEIPFGCFAYLPITSIAIPEGVDSIGEIAFMYCEELQTVEFPSTLVEIGERAFKYCNSIETLEIPEGVTTIGNDAFYTATYAGDYFTGFKKTCISNGKLESVSLPNSLKTIGDYAFYGSNLLTSVQFGTSMTEARLETIGEGAFAATSLSSVEIPDTVTSIGARAFDWQPDQDGAGYNNTIVRNWDSTLASIQLGSSQETSQLQTIGVNAFRDQPFTSIALPNTLQSLSYDISTQETPFDGCTKLRTIAWPTEPTVEGFTTVGGFWDCLALDDNGVINNLPSWIDTIDDYAFAGCAFTDIVIPEGVVTIGKHAFDTGAFNSDALEAGNGLTSVAIPASVMSIGDDAFGNNQLTSLTIADGDLPLTIGDYAFWFNRTLVNTTIELPARVSYVGADVFSGYEHQVNNSYYIFNKDIKFKRYDEAYSDNPPEDPWGGYGFASTIYYPQDADADSDIMRLKDDRTDDEGNPKSGMEFVPFDPSSYRVHYDVTGTVPDGASVAVFLDDEAQLPTLDGTAFTLSVKPGALVGAIVSMPGYADYSISPVAGLKQAPIGEDWTFAVTEDDMTPLSELGTLQVRTLGDYNENCNVAVFDAANGRLVSQGRVMRARVFVVDDVPAGAYDVVAWQENDYFSRVSGIGDFADMGLVASDYAYSQVEVGMREVKELSLFVPQLDTAKLAGIVESGDVVVPSAFTPPGVVFYARITYTMADGHTADALQVNIPEGMVPVSANSTSKGYGIEGWDPASGILTIDGIAAADKSTGRISLGLKADKAGDYAISAAVVSGSASVPLGAVSIESPAIQLVVPEGTMTSSEFTLHVYAEPERDITLMIGNTELSTPCTTNKVGHAQVRVTIPENELSVYPFYLMTAAVSGTNPGKASDVVQYYHLDELAAQPTVHDFWFEHCGTRTYLAKDGMNLSGGSYIIVASRSAHPSVYSDQWPFTVVVDSLQPLGDEMELYLGMLDENVHNYTMKLSDKADIGRGVSRYTYTLTVTLGASGQLLSNEIPCRFDINPQLTGNEASQRELTQAEVDAYKRNNVGFFNTVTNASATSYEEYCSSQAAWLKPYLMGDEPLTSDNPEYDQVFGIFNASYHHDVWDPDDTVWNTLTPQQQQDLEEAERLTDEAYDALCEILSDNKPLYEYASLQEYLEDNYEYQTGQSYDPAALKSEGYFIIYDNDITSVPGAGVITDFGDGTVVVPEWTAVRITVPESMSAMADEYEGVIVAQDDPKEQVTTEVKTSAGTSQKDRVLISPDDHANAWTVAGHSVDGLGLALGDLQGVGGYVAKGLGPVASAYITLKQGANGMRDYGTVSSQLIDRQNELIRLERMEEYYRTYNPDSDCHLDLKIEIELIKEVIADLQAKRVASLGAAVEGWLFGTLGTVSGTLAINAAATGNAALAEYSTIGSIIAAAGNLANTIKYGTFDLVTADRFNKHLMALKTFRATRENDCRKDKFGQLHYKKATAIDPSGWVYEAVDDNRLSDVQATIYQYVDGSWEQWDAYTLMEQENPQVTGNTGMFAWDVTPGEWRVLFTKAGYEDKWSEITPVPPEWTEMPINMLRTDAPDWDEIALSLADAGDEYMELVFNQYMKADAEFAPVVTVDGKQVTATWLDSVTGFDENDTEATLARTLHVPLSGYVAAGATGNVIISNAYSYAGRTLSEPIEYEVTMPDMAPTVWKRLWGQTALDTMAAIAAEGFEGADTVVVATWDGYWDALAASALAGAADAPVLLTDGKALSGQTRSEIVRLGAKAAYVCGGTSAVSEEVAGEIEAMGLSVARLGGATAVETSELISAEAVRLMGGADACVVATIDGFYDSLSFAPEAYALGIPVYLTDGDKQLKASTVGAIKSIGYSSAVIVGGEGAVKPAVEGQLEKAGVAKTSVERLGGANAWETSKLIADWGIAHDMGADGVGVADGTGFWDALTGAALCGRNRSVLVLVPRDVGWFTYNPYCIDEFVAPHASEIATGYVFGGEAAVPASTLAALEAATAR